MLYKTKVYISKKEKAFQKKIIIFELLIQMKIKDSRMLFTKISFFLCSRKHEYK